MTPDDASLRDDLEVIARIPFIPALLDVVCNATGMGYACVARVTEARWIAGAVKDKIQFGLGPGGELPVLSTLCHEVHQCGQPIVIDHVAHDARYAAHHTPATYGLESYISFPIFRNDGSFFGTLCAIDPRPALLNTPPVINLFKMLAALIAHYLDAMQALPPAELAKMDMYAGAELRNTLRDLADETGYWAAHTMPEKVSLLSLKIDQILMAMDPEGAFMA